MTAGVVGSVLNVQPILCIQDTTISSVAKPRGETRARQEMAKKVKKIEEDEEK